MSFSAKARFAWPLCRSDVQAATEVLLARAFGTSLDDLDVDFQQATRPAVVTQLVLTCVRDTQENGWKEDEIWQWPLPRRTQALLAVASATAGTGRKIPVMCSDPDCGLLMEVDLDLEQFRRACGETVFSFSMGAEGQFRLRVPSGTDQRDFGTSTAHDPLALVRRLIVKGNPQQFRSEWLSAVEKVLEGHDELTAMTLTTACPWCGRHNELEFDLEGYLLRDLQKVQQSMLDGVHKLARAYHWNEREILGLPARRRGYYLDRIEEDSK